MHRRKGSRIGPRTRAEAALLLAEGVAKAEIARRLGIARESLRQFAHAADGDLWLQWVEIARRRLAASVPRLRVIDELMDTVEIRAEKPDPIGAWNALRNVAACLAARAYVWNAKHGDALLATDPDELLALAAVHASEPAPGPGCEGFGGIFRAIADAWLDISPRGDRDALAELERSGAFIPWNSKGESQ
jgi:hypothetical protein